MYTGGTSSNKYKRAVTIEIESENISLRSEIEQKFLVLKLIDVQSKLLSMDTLNTDKADMDFCVLCFVCCGHQNS